MNLKIEIGLTHKRLSKSGSGVNAGDSFFGEVSTIRRERFPRTYAHWALKPILVVEFVEFSGYENNRSTLNNSSRVAQQTAPPRPSNKLIEIPSRFW